MRRVARKRKGDPLRYHQLPAACCITLDTNISREIQHIIVSDVVIIIASKFMLDAYEFLQHTLLSPASNRVKTRATESGSPTKGTQSGKTIPPKFSRQKFIQEIFVNEYRPATPTSWLCDSGYTEVGENRVYTIADKILV